MKKANENGKLIERLYNVTQKFNNWLYSKLPSDDKVKIIKHELSLAQSEKIIEGIPQNEDMVFICDDCLKRWYAPIDNMQDRYMATVGFCKHCTQSNIGYLLPKSILKDRAYSPFRTTSPETRGSFKVYLPDRKWTETNTIPKGKQ